MEIAALKTILMVQSQGSIAGAARALDVDPSSVSRTVSTVEADLGVRLFQRTTRRLAVTEEGQAYLTRLAPLIEEIDAISENARGLRGKPVGTLRMTASVAFTEQVIVPLLPKFQDSFPDITVDLQSSDLNLDLVKSGIDLAIRLAPAPKGDLISTRLFRTRYRIVTSPKYLERQGRIIHPSELSEYNCIRFALPGLQNTWSFQRQPEPTFEVQVSGNLMISNASALRSAARSGLGIALLPDWLINDDIQDGHLVVICEDYECTASVFDTAAWALYPNRTYLSQRVRVMIDFLKSNLPTSFD